MEMRHSVEGWPVDPTNSFGDYNAEEMKIYYEELSRAKEQSIKIELSQHEEIHIHLKYDAKPDTFIDFDGSVEVVWQHQRVFGGWADCSEEHYKSQYRSFPKLFRQVARLKPVESESSDRYIPQVSDDGSGMRNKIRELNARIKELEQDNAEGFEKYQELLVVNRNLKERVKELEDAMSDMITAPVVTRGMIIDGIQSLWIESYGVLDDKEERNGYFVAGFMDAVCDKLGIK
jgi:hypothetical protein